MSPSWLQLIAESITAQSIMRIIIIVTITITIAMTIVIIIIIIIRYHLSSVSTYSSAAISVKLHQSFHVDFFKSETYVTKLQICPLYMFGNKATDGTYGSKDW